MDKSTYKEQLPEQLITNNKQFKISVSLLPGYSGIFNVNDKKNKSQFATSINHDDFKVNTVPQGDNELESFDDESKRNITKKSSYTEQNYFCAIKPNFSAFGSFTEIKPTSKGSAN